MSKLFKQASRLNKTSYKFNLQLTVEALRLHPLHRDKEVVISITKGKKAVSTARPRKPEESWGDQLNLIATLYRDKHGRYQEKPYTILVKQACGPGSTTAKSLASFRFDASNYVSATGPKAMVELQSQNAKDGASLEVGVLCTFLKQSDGESEVSSMVDTEEQNLDFDDDSGTSALQKDPIMEDGSLYSPAGYIKTPLIGYQDFEGLRYDIKMITEERNVLAVQVEELQKELNDASEAASAKYDALRKEAEEGRAMIANLQGKVKELEEEVATAGQSSSTTEEVARLTKALEASKKSEAVFGVEVDRLEQALREARAGEVREQTAHEDAEVKLARFKARVTELEDQLTRSRAREDEVACQLEATKTALVHADQECGRLSSEVQSLRSSIEGQGDVAGLTVKLAEAERQVVVLQQELAMIKAAQGERLGQMEAMEKCLVESGREVERLQAEISLVQGKGSGGEEMVALQEEVKKEKAAKDRAVERADSLARELKEEKQITRALKVENEQGRKIKESLKAQVQLKEKERKEESDGNEATQRLLQQTFTELRCATEAKNGSDRMVQVLNDRVEKMEEALQRVSSELEEKRLELQKLKASRRHNKDRMSELEDSISSLTEEGSLMKRELHDYKELHQQFLEVKQAADTSMLETWRRLDRLNSEDDPAKVIQEEVDHLHDEISRLRVEITSRDVTEKELAQTVQILQHKVLQLEGDLKAAWKAKEDAEKQGQQLADEYGKVRELVNDVVKSKRDAEREALDARAKLKMWEDKRSKAKALLHVTTPEMECDVLHEQLAIMEEEMKVNKREWSEVNKSLCEEKEQFQNELISTKLQVAQLSTELDVLRHQLQVFRCS